MRRCLLILCCLLAGGCSRGADKTGPLPAAAPAEDARAFEARQLAELTTALPPAGVDAQVWQQLKDELGRLLRASGKAVRAAPAGDAAAAVLNFDLGTQALKWRYRCPGDYDQNGEINIADLTPLGVRFGASSGGGAFPYGSIESVVDGDDNGEINIADISPIGANFGRRAASYNVYYSTSVSDLPSANDGPNGAGAQLAGSVPLSGATGAPGGMRLAFSFTTGPPPPGTLYWVRPNDSADGGGQDGTPSNAYDTSSANQPPVAALFVSDATLETPPYTTEINLLGSSDPDGSIVQYEFDAEGDGNYEQVFASVPDPFDYTYNFPGLYAATVRVTDDGGATDTAAIPVEVQDPANLSPTASLVVDALAGEVPLTINCDASGSVDPDGTIVIYQWDFDGDWQFELETDVPAASHTYVNAGFQSVRLYVVDDGARRAFASQYVQVADPGNLAPIAKLTAAPLTGERPLTVHFDASQSVDTDGTIRSYEWDLDGDGSPDRSTATPYLDYTYYQRGTHYPSVFVQDNDNEASGADYAAITLDIGWQLMTILEHYIGYESRIVTVADGTRPLIAYTDADDNLSIKVRLGASDLSGFGEPVPATTGARLRFDLALVNNVPAISFCRDGGPGVGGLCYALAQDSLGSSWNTAIGLDLGGMDAAFEGSALALINGYPAVLYGTRASAEAHYVRANNLMGISWGAPVGLGTTGEPFALRNPSLLEAGGLPHAVYGTLGLEEGLHQPALDTDGVAWGYPPQTLAVDNINALVSAAVIDGVPACAYSANSKLYYRRASDAAATAWEAAQLVYASDKITTFEELRLCNIGGVPAIACHHSAYDRLLYFEAEDSAGLSWLGPDIVDSQYGAGDAMDMTELNGRPAIVYGVFLYNGPLRFAYLPDPT